MFENLPGEWLVETAELVIDPIRRVRAICNCGLRTDSLGGQPWSRALRLGRDEVRRSRDSEIAPLLIALAIGGLHAG
jgi:hypothetical protein